MNVIWHHYDAIFTGHRLVDPALSERLVETHGGHVRLAFDERLRSSEVRPAQTGLHPRFAFVDDSMLAQDFLNPVQEQAFKRIAPAHPFILPVIDAVLRPLALAPQPELLIRRRVNDAVPNGATVPAIGLASGLHADALAQLPEAHGHLVTVPFCDALPLILLG